MPLCPTCREPLSEHGDCPVCATAVTMVEARRPAPVFGDFEVLMREDGSPWELGRGAMGVTYRALDRQLQRHVALKVIEGAGNVADNPTARERFLREARAAASLRHTNIAGVFQFGVSSETGRCYYAMELVEGETLEARVRRDGPLTTSAALELAAQTTGALVAAAARDLIHRDLKPSNLMLTDGDMEVKVVDFGLARAAAPGTEADLTHGGFIGTPAYASPEQFARGPVDARSDIYSLGVTLWFALTGRAPFKGRNLDEISEDPARENLPLEQLSARKVPSCVIELLTAILSTDPAERPANARALLASINACRQSLTHDLTVLPPQRLALAPAKRATPGRLTAAVLAVALLVLGAGWWVWHSSRRPAPVAGVPEKSIAVLPFANLGDAENGYFAAGIQDEILTDLAKVADLKVISRTSAMAYGPGYAGGMRAIGQALGVAYLLEGSVQKAAGKVRVTAQLIDARTDAYLWAEHYDNDLSDIFRIQSDIAGVIARSLQARLSPAEKAAIALQPTADSEAYLLYVRAKGMVATYPQTRDWRATLLEAVGLLDQAIARDDHFALAYCLAAKAHGKLHGLDPTPAQLDLQEKAAAAALRLAPDLSEAHLAWALWLYRGKNDYAGARRELAIAQAALPNNADVFLLLSLLDRREGHWTDARANQRQASSLDPSNADVIAEELVLDDRMRLYAEFIRTADQAAGQIPASAAYFRLLKAQVLLESGKTAAARAVLDALPPEYDPNGATAYTRISAALYDGRWDEAAASLASFHGDDYPGNNGQIMPRAVLEALIARAAGETDRARQAFEKAREYAAPNAISHPTEPGAFALLGLVDAGLGRKEDALAEGRRSVDMLPVAQDAMDGPALVGNLAMICAWSAEPDEAMRLLGAVQDIPSGPDYGQLRLDPAWGALRAREDFQAMLRRLDPHVAP